MVLYPPPTRPWLYCRVCGVRLTREPIDVPFPEHESWCSQEKWRRIVYKACCRPLHRWLQRWRRLLFKAAQSPFPSMVFSAVASQAPSGDSWPRRRSDESSSSLGDPLGIARFKKPRRRETKETKDHSEEPSGSCAGAPSAPCLSSARPSSLPPRSRGRRALPNFSECLDKIWNSSQDDCKGGRRNIRPFVKGGQIRAGTTSAEADTSTARRTSPGRGTTDTRCLVHDLDAQPTWLWFAVLCFALPLASQRTWVPSHSRQRKRNPALFIADGIWQAPQINRIRWPILPL